MSKKKIWVCGSLNSDLPEEVSADRVADFQYSPVGMARYNYRKLPDGTYKFQYVYVGATREEVCAKRNQSFLDEISKLEDKINKIKALLIK